MPARKKPIPLTAHEDDVLRFVYVHLRIPRDQFKKRPEDLAEFTRMFNRLTGRHDSPEDLVHYIQTKQKAKRRLPVPWPTFDGDHQRAPALTHTLTNEQLQALRDAYKLVVLPFHLGTDSVLWNGTILAELAAEFTRRTGKIVPGLNLLAIAEERRKRTEWFKTGKSQADTEMGFGDLDAAESM